MSGLLKLLGNLISGIFGFLGGLLGLNKKSGYYLEYDESKALAATPNGAQAASTPAQPESAPSKPEPIAVKPEPVAAKSEPAATKPEPAAAKAEPIKTTPANPETVSVNNGLNLPQPTVTTFAPEYLLPKPTANRRRPGANMSGYLDMARQVKTPG